MTGVQTCALPIFYVYNKADVVEPEAVPGLAGIEAEKLLQALPVVSQDSIYMSARERIGLEELIRLIEKKLSGGYRDCVMLIPYTDGRAVSYLNENGVVRDTQYLEEGVRLSLQCREEDYQYYRDYLCG